MKNENKSFSFGSSLTSINIDGPRDLRHVSGTHYRWLAIDDGFRL